MPALKTLRLRFDRVAVGFVERLKADLSTSVPSGSVLVVTVTAPIRQDSKTGAALIEELRDGLASGRTRWKLVINGNHIQARLLGGVRGQKVVGFVHSPGPDPSVLFDATRAVLGGNGSG